MVPKTLRKAISTCREIANARYVAVPAVLFAHVCPQ